MKNKSNKKETMTIKPISKNNVILQKGDKCIFIIGTLKGENQGIKSNPKGEWEFNKAGEMGYNTTLLEMINLHKTLGNIVTWGSIVLLIGWVYLFFKNMEDKRIDKLAFAFLFLLVGTVFFTAYLGGQLVWIHGVGSP